ncbi:MAG: glycosyltransferase family 4 protein [Acidimicrobiales bacterium]
MANILVISNMYPPHHYGGYELACRDVVERWREHGHRVQVLTTTMRVRGVPDDAGESPPAVRRTLHLAFQDNKLTQAPLHRRRGVERANHAELETALGAAAADVVSVWGMGGMSTGLLTALTRTGIPLVYAVSDDWPTYATKLDPWMRLFSRTASLHAPLERLLGVPTALPDLGASGTWCFISNTTRQRCTRLSPWTFDDSTVTFGGIDHRDFPPSEPSQDRPWRWRLLSAGRLDPRKGVQVAIRALALLPPEATLDVLSPVDDPYRRDLEAVAADVGVSSRVTFGVAARRELRRSHQEADVFVFPTLWEEPFGYAPIEAMACGTPVVATGTGGSGEFLVDGVNCIRCVRDDPASLAAGVRRLAGSSDTRRRIVKAGVATAREFSVDRFAEVLETWHLSAASGHAAGRPADRALPDWS